jgi:catalase
MEGHSVNTYTMINAEGKESYVKFIWMPKGGEGKFAVSMHADRRAPHPDSL